MRWATRRHCHVDRAACAWLISRFIDAEAEFVFVDDPDEVPPDATPFDMRGVELSHHGGDCSRSSTSNAGSATESPTPPSASTPTSGNTARRGEARSGNGSASSSTSAGRSPARARRRLSSRFRPPGAKMPDRFGFNLLGDTVRCIDCPAGGPIWNWPERKRRRHARAHRPDPRRSRRDLRRQRDLLAAPPMDSYEEKEAITMSKQPAARGEPAKQVAIDVLRKARGPLHAKEIAKRVIASGRCSGLKGKTPEQTITAMLAVGSKPGGPFTRVDKGTYALTEAATAPADEGSAQKTASKPRTRRRQKQAPTA
jgi:Chromate resistance exported protein/HB1, ASXL, restriction endonuclease HTH domain